MAVYLKTEDEIELMRESNRLVAKTLAELSGWIRPGISTLQLNNIADEFIRDHGATPAFLGFHNPYGSPFPGSICTSVNDCVVHGVPSASQILKDGDIVSVDCGTVLNGYCGDAAYTYCVGEVDSRVKALLTTTERALYEAISIAVTGTRLGDIGHCIQTCCERKGYGVVRELSGHGIGRAMHEDPQVDNYGRRHSGLLLQEGMCLAIEPMATLGRRDIFLSSSDRWAVHTKDGKPAAHFEHTIVVRRGRAEILSVRE
ncbi:MAG: type I methionyl aminopeptidase [Bacteroidaceae bacterium]|nr:type I methionyl aminopeptidase [Bacteroidaceae bacterium]